MRRLAILLLAVLYPLLAATNALAHKVNIFAYVEDGTVYTESYFPDGRKVQGGTVEVYDAAGKKLVSG
ncbi:MAG TPA: carboxypeptidase regulatory-like domain-containing protein, partial [Desulfobacterales bacterium]|nr:carboxypeptidase regulatory-like domain-containing protein [Desulfobacterales bacterium]